MGWGAPPLSSCRTHTRGRFDQLGGAVWTARRGGSTSLMGHLGCVEEQFDQLSKAVPVGNGVHRGLLGARARALSAPKAGLTTGGADAMGRSRERFEAVDAAIASGRREARGDPRGDQKVGQGSINA